MNLKLCYYLSIYLFNLIVIMQCMEGEQVLLKQKGGKAIAIRAICKHVATHSAISPQQPKTLEKLI